jgi:hypothetical protein
MRALPQPCGPRASQRGQALAEVVVLAAVLVPLFLLLPIVAKYIHLRHVAEQAARAAAWQATVSQDYALPDKQRTQRMLIERHFGRADAELLTEIPSQPADASVEDAFVNTFSDHTLLKRQDVTLTAYRDEQAPGLMGRILGLVEKFPGSFPPNENGLVTASIELRPQNLKRVDGRPAAYLAPFDSIDLQMEASHTLLADTWNAAGAGAGRYPHDRSVTSQVRTLVPTAMLGQVPDLGALEIIPIIGVIGRLELGLIKPDVVPKPRLQPYEPAP